MQENTLQIVCIVFVRVFFGNLWIKDFMIMFFKLSWLFFYYRTAIKASFDYAFLNHFVFFSLIFCQFYKCLKNKIKIIKCIKCANKFVPIVNFFWLKDSSAFAGKKSWKNFLTTSQNDLYHTNLICLEKKRKVDFSLWLCLPEPNAFLRNTIMKSMQTRTKTNIKRIMNSLFPKIKKKLTIMQKRYENLVSSHNFQ